MSRCLRDGRLTLKKVHWMRCSSSFSPSASNNEILDHIRNVHGDVGLHQDLALVPLLQKRLISQDTLSHDSLSLLNTSTKGFLPSYQGRTLHNQYWLHLGHQQVYFRPHLEPLSLLSDGTDSRFLPGDASVWKFRVWAGGSVAFGSRWPLNTSVPTAGEQTETIEKIRIIGQTTPEKVFVTVKKKIDQLPSPVSGSTSSHPRVQDDESLMVETYTLCFLRNPLFHAIDRRKIRPPSEAMFTHNVVPDSNLLFQFSAMTNNAHKIHYDATFARREYGLGGLVVHGPLIQFLLAEFLRVSLCTLQDIPDDVEIVPTSMHYSNIEPLYVDENMTLCCKPMDLRDDQEPWKASSWRVWIQKGKGKEAALAVKAEVNVKHWSRSKTNSEATPMVNSS